MRWFSFLLFLILLIGGSALSVPSIRGQDNGQIYLPVIQNGSSSVTMIPTTPTSGPTSTSTPVPPTSTPTSTGTPSSLTYLCFDGVVAREGNVTGFLTCRADKLGMNALLNNGITDVYCLDAVTLSGTWRSNTTESCNAQGPEFGPRSGHMGYASIGQGVYQGTLNTGSVSCNPTAPCDTAVVLYEKLPLVVLPGEAMGMLNTFLQSNNTNGLIPVYESGRIIHALSVSGDGALQINQLATGATYETLLIGSPLYGATGTYIDANGAEGVSDSFKRPGGESFAYAAVLVAQGSGYGLCGSFCQTTGPTVTLAVNNNQGSNIGYLRIEMFLSTTEKAGLHLPEAVGITNK